MERVKIEVRAREGRGTKDAKALRADGDIPGVIYSATSETEAIVLSARDLRHALSGAGMHAVYDVSVDGKKTRPVLIKEFQLDPVRDRVIHVDLHEIRLDQKINTSVVGAPRGPRRGREHGRRAQPADPRGARRGASGRSGRDRSRSTCPRSRSASRSGCPTSRPPTGSPSPTTSRARSSRRSRRRCPRRSSSPRPSSRPRPRARPPRVPRAKRARRVPTEGAAGDESAE